MGNRLAIDLLIKDGGIYVFTLAGNVDLVGARGLEGLANACELQGIDRVILQVSAVRDINAPGLGALLEFAKDLEGRGGMLILVRVPLKVRRFFLLHDVYDHFNIRKDLVSSLQEIKAL